MCPWIALVQATALQLCSQVRGYAQHLSKMNLTVPQLRESGIGKRLKRITRWNDLRVKTSGQPQDSVGEVAEWVPSSACAFLPCMIIDSFWNVSNASATSMLRCLNMPAAH